MAIFRLSGKARSDLIAIGRYTESTWGRVQRNRYLTGLDRCFAQLADSPELGVECAYIRQGYRKFPYGSHIIFYRHSDAEIIDVIRIFHKGMDVESRFGN